MHRADLIARLSQPQKFDIAIIGGGATGLGVALDACLRGFRVLLLESHDFAKGTSSRSTKLVHGGVRYLAQGNISLVRESLRERSTLLHNAPHLANALAFVIPSYKRWETPYYGLGLKAYDALAGSAGLGATELLSKAQTLHLLPTVRDLRLKGGVKYWDGQFDDARLALALARTAAAHSALLVNYCAVTGLRHEGDKVVGLHCEDRETGKRYAINATCVINATGVWVDELRRLDGAAQGRQVKPMVAPSQGVHLVVDRAFMPTDHALMVPKTTDGRVLFAVPWLGKTLLGTTDTPRHDLAREPTPFAAEVDFILSESARYLSRAPQPADVKSVWVGLRPLVKHPGDDGDNTKRISREHTVLIGRSGLVTVTGGKWTTYRAMAADVLEKCMEAGLLRRGSQERTQDFALLGAQQLAHDRPRLCDAPGLHSYGSEAAAVSALPGADAFIGPGLSEAMVRFAVRYEFARTVEDVLARRSRLLFLDAALAARLAPQVAQLLRQETGIDPKLEAFLKLAQQYQFLPTKATAMRPPVLEPRYV